MGDTFKELKLGLNGRSTCDQVRKAVSKIDKNLCSSLQSSTTIVTGSNSGIGKKAAQHLAYLGATVVFACRNLEKANKAIEDIKSSPELEKVNPELKKEDLKMVAMKLDLGSLKSVQEFAEALKGKITQGELPKLRLVVCNAGLASLKAPHTTTDGFEKTFGVNHLGHFFMMKLLLSGDEAELNNIWSEDGCRVVNVSSHSHYGPVVTKAVTDEKTMLHRVVGIPQEGLSKKSHSIMKAYGSSKLCNVHYTKSLSKLEVPGLKITAASLHPGAMIPTEIASDSAIGQFIVKKMFSFFTKSIDQGSSTTFLCSVLPDDYIKGQYFSDCKEVKPSKLSLGEIGDQAGELLWKISDEICEKFLAGKL